MLPDAPKDAEDGRRLSSLLSMLRTYREWGFGGSSVVTSLTSNASLSYGWMDGLDRDCGGSPRGGGRDGRIRAQDSINDVDFRAYIFTKSG